LGHPVRRIRPPNHLACGLQGKVECKQCLKSACPESEHCSLLRLRFPPSVDCVQLAAAVMPAACCGMDGNVGEQNTFPPPASWPARQRQQAASSPRPEMPCRNTQSHPAQPTVKPTSPPPSSTPSFYLIPPVPSQICDAEIAVEDPAHRRIRLPPAAESRTLPPVSTTFCYLRPRVATNQDQSLNTCSARK
jgi:hypothetical protein